jgi:hypothetical protein
MARTHGGLPKLNSDRWPEFAWTSTDPTTAIDPDTAAAQKLTRDAYRKIGKATAEHAIVLILGQDLVGKPTGHLKVRLI